MIFYLFFNTDNTDFSSIKRLGLKIFMTVIYITIPETEPIAIAIYGFVIRKDEINTGIDAIKTIIKIDNVSMS